MNLDTYMDAFGRDLTSAARTRRRRGTRRRLALALPVAAAATAVAIVVPGRGGTVDAIAAARAALAPKDEIVHMKIESGRFTTEQWYARDPVRWRTRNDRAEIASAGHRLRVYDPRRDVVTIFGQAELALGPTPIGSDPATDLREALEQREVRDDGIVTVDGRQVRRLVRDKRWQAFTYRLVYYMDPDTFAPVGGHGVVLRRGREPMSIGSFTVTTYERLPLNAETQKLLRLPKTAKTRYVWRD
jgi:hypothetical protein